MARVIGQKAINNILKDKDGVQDAVYEKAEYIGGKAAMNLAAHYRSGDSEILVRRGDVDSYVILDDPAAMSIEFGHENVRTGGYTQGLYIITGAAGLI